MRVTDVTKINIAMIKALGLPSDVFEVKVSFSRKGAFVEVKRLISTDEGIALAEAISHYQLIEKDD